MPHECCVRSVIAGETNPEVIQSNVRKAIVDKFPLYCLGFGFDVNFKFLETMSLQNNGVARRIYEDSDADLQLKVFSGTSFTMQTPILQESNAQQPFPVATGLLRGGGHSGADRCHHGLYRRHESNQDKLQPVLQRI